MAALKKLFLLNNLWLVVVWILLLPNLLAQSSSEIYRQLEKFNSLGKVLYIAAHPDDENTAVISYFANYRMVSSAYLSLTRGDGGQNLIGSELREELGLIRTQELIRARKIDKGHQLFTTAIDFGYSKSPTETFSIWGRESILNQMIDIIQRYKPDIIINRFGHQSAGLTHGHHTASAILSIEAFDIIEQRLKNGAKNLWKPRRIFHNTTWWLYGNRENFENVMQERKLLKIDVGVYDQLTGVANSEIAALSRSQHKSQGFGSSPRYGTNNEYFDLVRGDPHSEDIFDGIDISWNRVKNGQPIDELMQSILSKYDFLNPQSTVKSILKLYPLLENLEDKTLLKEKTTELNQILKNILGLILQFNTDRPTGVPHEKIPVEIKLMNPSPIKATLKSVVFNQTTLLENIELNQNKPLSHQVHINNSNDYSTPDWLLEKGTLGNYTVSNIDNRYLAQASNPNQVTFKLNIGGREVTFEEGLKYRTTNPVHGEIVQEFHTISEATVAFEDPVVLFQNTKPKQVIVSVTAHRNDLRGKLSLDVSNLWKVHPSSHDISIEKSGEKSSYIFKVTPPADQISVESNAIIEINDKKINYALKTIDYPHIEKQFVLIPNTSKFIHLDLKSNVSRVAYISGAGDDISQSLQSVGIEVVELDIDRIQSEDLLGFKTVIVGIRAFNIKESLVQKNNILWDFARKGGTLIIQYNTSRDLVTQQITPFDISISRNRITDENSPVDFLDPDHPILRTPNKINLSDFEGWVQERGLYFPDSWDNRFVPILEMNDPGETSLLGSLLVSDYYEGKIIYTGLSFFRELPAGVSGAFRLYLNLISYGHEKD